MRQKVAFCIALIDNPDIVLLDEPSTGLDIESCSLTISLLKALKEDGKTVLIATHNISEIADLSDQIAILKNGRIELLEETAVFFDGVSTRSRSEHVLSYLEDECDV